MTGVWALAGGRVLLRDGLRDGVAVLIHGSTIVGVARDGEVPAGMARVDVGGRLVTPGLVDIHVHGAFGRSFDAPGAMDENADATSTHQALRYLACRGVTSVQTSLASNPIDRMVERADAIAGRRATMPDDAAEVLGVHLEGPFLAAAQRGAHDANLLVAPDEDNVARILEVHQALGMVTIAPELPGALAATRRFADAGVVVAAGHSEATSRELRPCIDAGLSHITHLWSGQSTVRRHGPWRVPGLLEESLASDTLTAEVIADGRHLPPQLLDIARRCVGDRLVVVSDGTAGTGMPVEYHYDVAAVRCVVADGVGMVVGADAFGGSTSCLPRMLAHLHDDLGWPLSEVVDAATTRPAAVAAVAQRKGTIATGFDADLAVFDPGFRPWGTVLRGRWLPRPDVDEGTRRR